MGFYYIVQIKWADDNEVGWCWKTEKVFSNLFEALIELKRLRNKYPDEEYKLHKECMGA